MPRRPRETPSKPQARPECPDCGTLMIPTPHGFKCPRLGSCGRGGIEETKKRPGGDASVEA